MVIRDASRHDFEDILVLNRGSEDKTSPMSLIRLSNIDAISCYHKVVLVQDKIVAFAVAMLNQADYLNDNFAWFKQRYSKFLYLDRIVVDDNFGARGIGSYVYKDLITHASEVGAEYLVCEYNLEPLNIASQALHKKFEFTEVGQKTTVGNTKRVSMQARTI